MNYDSPKSEQEINHEDGNIVSYLIGFFISLALTLCSYFIVVKDLFSLWTTISLISALAVIQMIVQLVFFLHLGREIRPRWNLLSFLFMSLVVLLLVAGTLWIMYNLDDRVMPAANMSKHYY